MASIATQVSLKTILFATDFSDASEKAVAFTAALARKHQSKVFIAHVLPEPQPAVTRPGISERDERIRATAAMQLQDFATSALFRPVKHEELLLEGSCWSVLEQVIEDKGIDLVILGTHGRSGVGELLLGSVAEAVFRHSPCPVITVGPHSRLLHTVEAEIDRVLYTTDLGGHYDALPYAISIAEENNAQLIMLHVLEGTAVLPYDVPENWAEQAKHQMRDLLPNNLRDSTEFLAEMGRPAREILATSLIHNVDLIVMGVHADGHGPAHTPWAVAHQVVGRAPCPVMTVRSKA